MVRIHHGSPYCYFGRLAQLVERYPYKVDVISSSLISTTRVLLQCWPHRLVVRIHGFHPCYRSSSLLGVTNIIIFKSAVVAQLVRVSACHAECREFESRQPRHFFYLYTFTFYIKLFVQTIFYHLYLLIIHNHLLL